MHQALATHCDAWLHVKSQCPTMLHATAGCRGSFWRAIITILSLQVPAIPESQPLAGNGVMQLQSAASTGSNIGLQSASSGTMLRTGSTAAADQRAKNIEVPSRCGCHSPAL